jgi:hypothetical protein
MQNYRLWIAAGAVLVIGVVAWRLLGSTYKSDVEVICNAEKGSGMTIKTDMPKVNQWVKDHLATPEGNKFFSELVEARLADRVKRLQSEASSVGAGACPMVDAYTALAAEGDYRSDLQRLCSNATFPKLVELDDQARLAKLQAYIDKDAKSPRTKDLSGPLAAAATPADRAKVLREAATKLDVYSCDVAKTLESPRAEATANGTPIVRVYATPQINGGLKEEDLAKAIAAATPDMQRCYQKGIEKKADLAGKMHVRLSVKADGKIDHATDMESQIPDKEVVGCILKLFDAMKVPPPPGPATAMVPLELALAPASAAPSRLAPSSPSGSAASLPAPARSFR